MKDACPFKFLVAVVALSLVAGCAFSKPVHQPGLVTSWNQQEPLPSVDAPPIALVLRTRRTYADDRPSTSRFFTWRASRASHQALHKALPYFPVLANAQVGLTDAPYRLVIEATQTNRVSELRTVFTALSLFLIPLQQELAIELEAKLYRGATLVKSYRATGTHHQTVHLFNLPVWAFRYRVPDRTSEQTFCDLFLQLQRDAPSFFPTPEPAGT